MLIKYTVYNTFAFETIQVKRKQLYSLFRVFKRFDDVSKNMRRAVSAEMLRSYYYGDNISRQTISPVNKFHHMLVRGY